MCKALTYQTIKQLPEKSAQRPNVTNNQTELKENSTQGGNVANNQTEFTENNAQRTNVPNNQTQLTENSAQGTTKETIKKNSRNTVRKALTYQNI